MEEINLRDLFKYFLSKKIYIVLITLFAVLIGIVYSNYYKVPMYKSYTTVLLTKEVEANTITYNDINLNKNLVDTYSEIVRSRKVVGKVINNLKLDYSIGFLQSRINVSSINDTEIIKITVIDEDSNKAMKIANEAAKVFNDEIIKLYSIQNIGVVDVAEEASIPYNINLIKTSVLALLIGLVLSCGLVFIMFYFDTTIKNVEEVEEKLGLPVIGKVPMIGGKKHE